MGTRFRWNKFWISHVWVLYFIHLDCILISFFLATCSKKVKTFSIWFTDILRRKQIWNFRKWHLLGGFGCRFSVYGFIAVSISFGIWNTVIFWNKNLTWWKTYVENIHTLPKIFALSNSHSRNPLLKAELCLLLIHKYADSIQALYRSSFLHAKFNHNRTLTFCEVRASNWEVACKLYNLWRSGCIYFLLSDILIENVAG